MIRLKLLTALACLIAATCAAQTNVHRSKSGVLSPQKVYMSFEGRRDSLIFPVISDEYPQLKAILSEQNLFLGGTLKQVVEEHNQSGFGITYLDYEISFENAKVLSIIFNYETMGAYPSSYRTWMTIDLKTGQPYKINNEITQSGLNWLYQTYKTKMKKAILQSAKMSAEHKEEYDKLYGSIDTLSRGYFLSHYIFSTSGMSFTSENVLPHATRALEEDRDWFITYKYLRKYKKRGAAVLR